MTFDDPNVISGTYTPVRSAEVNLDVPVIMSLAQWSRDGNTIKVAGFFTADPTLTATNTSFEISLILPPIILAIEDVTGSAVCGNIYGLVAEINGVVGNNTAKIFWVSSDITSQKYSYSLTYQLLP